LILDSRAMPHQLARAATISSPLVAERDFSIWTIDLLRGMSSRVATGPRMGCRSGRPTASGSSTRPSAWGKSVARRRRKRLRTTNREGLRTTPWRLPRSPDGTEILLHSRPQG